MTREDMRKQAENKARALAAQLLHDGSPTDTPEAEQFWNMLSGDSVIPAQLAAKIYHAGGYLPFKGFPLTRAGRHVK